MRQQSMCGEYSYAGWRRGENEKSPGFQHAHDVAERPRTQFAGGRIQEGVESAASSRDHIKPVAGDTRGLGPVSDDVRVSMCVRAQERHGGDSVRRDGDAHGRTIVCENPSAAVAEYQDPHLIPCTRSAHDRVDSLTVVVFKVGTPPHSNRCLAKTSPSVSRPQSATRLTRAHSQPILDRSLTPSRLVPLHDIPILNVKVRP